MRGSPPLHLVLFVVGFALLAVPLAQLTFARPARPAEAREEAPSADTPTVIRLRFAHVPSSVSLKLDGAELLGKSSGPLSNRLRMETRGNLHIPSDGIELGIAAKWPQGTPDTAVTLELEPDGLDAQSQTRWSSGASLNEVLSYQWKP
jgi:hypothetical protein